MTVIAQGTVSTQHGSRYLQQLCKHWSHKFETSFDANQGTIELPGGPAELTAEAEALRIVLRPKNADGLDRFKQVVEEHLNRFAFREAPLAFTWQEGEA